jgi:mono/diheme cytochrome c family protein
MTTKHIALLLLCGFWLEPIARGDEDDDIRLFMQGRFAFGKHCAVCHGKTGRGDGELAEGVTIRPRDFRKGVFKFRTTPMGKLPTDADLERTIRSGVSGSMMPAFGSLNDSDLKALIAYIKEFSPRWEDPELKAEPIEIPEPPEWFGSKDELGTHVAEGGKLFALHCASCHGPAGKGDGLASKGLVDIWGDRITPADLAAEHLRSGDRSGDVFRTVALGLDGTPMVGFLETLGADAIWDLVAFVATLSVEE